MRQNTFPVIASTARRSIALVTLFCASVFSASPVIGYFPHWAQYSQFSPADVRYNLLTEIRYGYVVPSGAELVFADESDKENFAELIKQAKAAKVKLVVSVGGLGNEGAMSDAYSNSADFVKAATNFKNEHGIDGFELDGGTVDASGTENLLKLADDLASAGFSVSVALPGDEGLASAVGSKAAKLDAVSLWLTDQASAGDGNVKPNSDNAFNEKVLAAFAKAGVEKSKLVVIVPFYGKTFYHAKGLGSSHEGAGSGNEGVLQYRDILEKFNGNDYSVSFDDASKSEIAVSENEAIVFNGIPSMKAIAESVKNSNYGGVAAFDISGDHKEPIVSLLVTIGQVLRPDINYKKKK